MISHRMLIHVATDILIKTYYYGMTQCLMVYAWINALIRTSLLHCTVFLVVIYIIASILY